MDALTVTLFIVGLVLLVVGANLLVDGASTFATRIGISPLVVGLTIVAFGTSSPELAVTLQATFTGEAGVAVGNVVGTAVFNSLFILGITALIRPLRVTELILKRDGLLMLAAAILLLIFTLDRELSRLEGAVLFLIIVAYTVHLIRRARTTKQPETATGGGSQRSWPVQVVKIAVGLVMLVVGAGWIVDGAVEFAESLGISSVLIGLTVVAIGTGMPEVAIAVLATIRRQTDIAVGNVVGSNLFVLLAVLGLAALVSPAAVPIPESIASFDIPIFVAVAIASVLSFATGYRVSRWEGGMFVGFYILYLIYLILETIDHPAFEWFRVVSIALAVAGLALLVVQTVRARRSSTASASG